MTVNQKYQIVIPKEIRKRFPIRPNDKLVMSVDDQGNIIVTRVPTFEELRGTAKFPENYLQNERDSWEK